MRVRTPAIRCDRPTIQGLPAFSPAQCPRVGGKLILPQRTFSCDAKDHARLRKDLGQNIFLKRGVQVELQLGVTIPERAGLRCAAAGTGYLIPVGGGQGFAGLALARIGVNDGAAGRTSERNRTAVGGWKSQVGQHHPGEMRSSSIVDRLRQVLRQGVDGLHQPFSRIKRARSRSQERCFSVSRLSCSFLPRPRPSSTFARPRSLKYILSGMTEKPSRCVAPISLLIWRLCSSSRRGRRVSWLKRFACKYSGM